LTEWSVESLRREFAQDGSCFYILTNSRSLPASEAGALMQTIASHLTQAAGDDSAFDVVSRSDSTLRGHFPLETDILDQSLGPFRATLVIPYFEAGGRYTIDDVHYVQEGDRLVPAAATPFASDSVFGYEHSDLKDWIEEKTSGRIPSEKVHSLSLDRIRTQGPAGVATFLSRLETGSYCVVNAAHPADLHVLVTALKDPCLEGVRFLYRTGAEFVSTYLGLQPYRLSPRQLLSDHSHQGGLIVVGSYVPLTTLQLESLLGEASILPVECEVTQLLDPAQRTESIRQISAYMNGALESGKDVVVYTSRPLARDTDSKKNLNIGQSISEALVSIVGSLRACPKFLIAKGGITSSDVATKALQIRRAMVKGQALPGIPVWEAGQGSKFPGLPYVVFPGNVGDKTSLLNIYRQIKT